MSSIAFLIDHLAGIYNARNPENNKKYQESLHSFVKKLGLKPSDNVKEFFNKLFATSPCNIPADYKELILFAIELERDMVQNYMSTANLTEECRSFYNALTSSCGKHR